MEGVIAAGANNNAKDSGSLIPTIAFGIPGSVSMAVLLGAFIIAGLQPGPEMLTTNVDVTFSMVWITVISNVIAVIAGVPADQAAGEAVVPARNLARALPAGPALDRRVHREQQPRPTSP